MPLFVVQFAADANALPLRVRPLPRPLLCAFFSPHPAQGNGSIFLGLEIDQIGAVFRIGHGPAGLAPD
jgi:hypothetical protein